MTQSQPRCSCAARTCDLLVVVQTVVIASDAATDWCCSPRLKVTVSICAGDNNASTSELMYKLKLRAPYVAPLNILQALSMASIRAQEQEQQSNSMDGQGGSTGDLSGGSPRSHRLGRLGRTMSSFRIKEHFNAYADPETWALLNRDPENVPDKDMLMQARCSCASCLAHKAFCKHNICLMVRTASIQVAHAGLTLPADVCTNALR